MSMTSPSVFMNLVIILVRVGALSRNNECNFKFTFKKLIKEQTMKKTTLDLTSQIRCTESEFRDGP